MTKRAILVLEDGSVYEGFSFGAESTTCGEVVFDTIMAGYQEMLTDPSFAGQIVVPTYFLIGNYAINESDIESKRIQVRGFVVRHYCATPSHYRNIKTLNEYLSENNIPRLFDVDTRSLTRRLRSAGVMKGILRRAAAEKGIPCFTSLDTACVAWKALALGSQIFNVKPLREYISAPV